MSRVRGFTLIELMIVVAIIAILAAIAISQYSDYLIRTQISEGTSLGDGMKSAVGEFYTSHGRFATGSNASYGLSIPTSIAGSFVASVGISGGVITAHFSNQGGKKANASINGQSLELSPVTHGGSMEWKCNRSNALKSKWVPSICRG